MANLPAYNWKTIFSDGVQTTRTNLVTNPSFELNTTGWAATGSGTGAISRSTTYAYSGGASVERTVTANGVAYVQLNVVGNIPVTAGLQYTLSAYVRGSAARNCYLVIQWRTAANAFISNTTSVASNCLTTAFKRYNVTGTAPATAASAIIYLATDVLIGDLLYWDAILFEQTSSLEAYFDGTNFDALTPPKYVNTVAWTGTANASTSTEKWQNWYQLPDIQTIDIFRGRRIQIDDYSIDNATIVSRNPSGWTNTPKLGDDIQIYVDAPGYVTGVSTFPMFWGNIRNVSIDYGKVATEDEVTIACEGLQAEWGRAQLNGYTLASQLTDESISQLGDEVGLETAQFYGRSTNSAITFTGNAFDLANGLTRTEEARMWAFGTPLGYEPRLWWFGRNAINTSTWWFTDGTATSNLTAQLYEGIEFRSSADNYYNEVTITPDAVAAQTASLGVTPVFGWDKNTYDVSTTQALNHAEWVLGNFQNKNQAIASLTYTEIQQDNLTGAGQPNGEPVTRGQTPIATNFAVVFRGTTYYVVGEGIQISARPGQTRFTIFFSGRDQNAYFILNDAVYGTLDFNKLGF